MSYVAVATELMCSVYIVLCVCHHVHCESTRNLNYGTVHETRDSISLK